MKTQIAVVLIAVTAMLGCLLSGCGPNAEQIAKEKEAAARSQRVEQMVAKRDAERQRKVNAQPEAKKNRGPSLSIRYTDTRLYVASRESGEIESLTFYLNAPPPNTWSSKIGPIPLNREFYIPLNEFIMKDGRRFDPFAYKVTEVWAGGSGFDYARFSP